MDIVREADPATGTGETHGQFAPRIAANGDRSAYSSALSGASTGNAAIFQRTAFVNEVLIARKGVTAPYAGASPFSAFIGESSDFADTVLYRATLGAPSTVADNEGLWTRTTAGVVTLVMRKGDVLPGLAGVKIAKFINYWQCAGQSLALVQLTGSNVTAANDQALIEYQTTGPATGMLLVLMREGDSAPGCCPAKVGVINRVDVDPKYGNYLVIASLAGGPAGRDLAIFRGAAARSLSNVTEQITHRPTLLMRKGQFFNDHSSKVKTLAFSNSGVTASGAGNVGLAATQSDAYSETQMGPFVLNVGIESGEQSLLVGRRQ
jgi:hypothetical protein